MARIVCRACGYDGDGEVDGAPRCPSCQSLDCRAAIAVGDLPTDVAERIAASTPAPEYVIGLDATTEEALARFLERGHVPITRGGEPARLRESWWRDDEGEHRGVECSVCGYRHDSVRYTSAVIPLCDGAIGKARRWRRQARVSKAMWERAEAAARQAEREAGTLVDPLGYDVSDVEAAARLMADDVANNRDPEARAGELARARASLTKPARERVEAVMARYGLVDANEARGWETALVIYLVLEILRTVPEHKEPAVDQAIRLLSDIGVPPR